ncbi:TonB-dependent receptor [Pseudoalteromonas luteoviolacea]|uniref:TonB-dependent receptor n=1 Tax=Pseudoalteromonas luteoviolacea TaxID=43657 RepID=A0A0C1MV39_9GAMM|nr:TonB-dependent receptor [Pseudoalteromonas luteoviolacea]KID58818.1 TonB-dependent receptor [Pseudoalteromonas luteoviolacea]
MKSGFSYSLIAIALLQADVVWAQQQNDDIEKIIVTASRTIKANTDLALSAGSVSTEVIRNDNAQHVSESLETISGVLLNQLSGGQGHNAAIRMPINFGGYTLYLQDNVPLQSAAFYNHNALWWASTNSSVSRLEVIKGAGTSLYGSGAVAATVNVISAPIDEDSNEFGITLGESSYQRVNGSKTYNMSDSNGIRVSAAYLNNEGWRDHSSVEKSELNVLHELQLDGKQSLRTSLIASTLDQQMLNTLSEEAFLQDPTQSGLQPAVLAIDPRRKTDYLRISSEYVYDDNDLYASVIPYFRYRTNDYIATWQPSMPNIESSVRSIGLLALTNFRHSVNFETTFGIDLERSEGDDFSYQPTTVTTTGWGAATYPQGHIFYKDSTTFTGISPYIQHSGQLTEQLSYALGLRYDHNKYQFDNKLPAYDNDGFGNRSIASREDTFKHLSPKASLNYTLDAQSSIYARYANAIRIPTASELYHLKSKETSSQLGSINEETSDTYEVGYKANLENLSIELAYYVMDVKEAIVTATDGYGASFRVNASEVRHQGFELGTTYTFSPTWSLALAYSQSDHEFVHYIKGNNLVKNEDDDLSNNSLVMAPEYVANLRLNYNSQFIAGLNVTAEIKSIGDYWMDSENTRQYSGYTIANLKANYQVTDALKLHARVANITDKTYALQAEIRFNKERIQPGAPRMAYVGLSYTF